MQELFPGKPFPSTENQAHGVWSRGEQLKPAQQSSSASWATSHLPCPPLSSTRLVGKGLLVHPLLLLDDLRRLWDPLAEDVPLEKPREHHGQLMLDEMACRDGENLCEGKISRNLDVGNRGLALTIQFFEGELFGFSDEAEDHEPGDEVEARVEANCRKGQDMNFWWWTAGGDLQAPVAVKACCKRGKVILRRPAKRKCKRDLHHMECA